MLRKYYQALANTAAIKLTGKVTESFGVRAIEAQKIESAQFLDCPDDLILIAKSGD